MSAEPDDQLFADGISEELLNAFAQVEGLGVASRTSSFAYRGQKVRAGNIGRALGVAHVLEGSVRRSGERVRITAQLIDTTTDRHLWSNTYDRLNAYLIAGNVYFTLAGAVPPARRRRFRV
jgi:TolB-like protein